MEALAMNCGLHSERITGVCQHMHFQGLFCKFSYIPQIRMCSL